MTLAFIDFLMKSSFAVLRALEVVHEDLVSCLREGSGLAFAALLESIEFWRPEQLSFLLEEFNLLAREPFDFLWFELLLRLRPP